MATKPKFYMVYRAKDDSIAAVGSAAECAKQLGFTDVHSFYTLAHRVKTRHMQNIRNHHKRE